MAVEQRRNVCVPDVGSSWWFLTGSSCVQNTGHSYFYGRKTYHTVGGNEESTMSRR